MTYETDDLGLASFLHASGVKFHGLKKLNHAWKKAFVFDEPEPVLLSAWENGSALINAVNYWKSSRFLKHELKKPKK